MKKILDYMHGERKNVLGGQRDVSVVRALAILTKALGSIPCTYKVWLPAICNVSSRESDAFCWPLLAPAHM